MKTPITNHTQPSHDYIYEAQISVLVTGIDDWVWAAYCFADVYFKPEGHSETVEHYSNSQIKLDPPSCGRHPANPPVWIPREYYLRALSSRMDQVKQEWNNSVSRLVQQTEPYVCNPKFCYVSGLALQILVHSKSSRKLVLTLSE